MWYFISLVFIFSNSLSGLHLRWPRWVCPPLSATCGSGWEGRSTAATRGTPKPTPTRLFLTSVAAASTGFTSAPLPRMASNIWPRITWPWWDWTSWTVDATRVITGESTVASLRGRKCLKHAETCQLQLRLMSSVCIMGFTVPAQTTSVLRFSPQRRFLCERRHSTSSEVSWFDWFYLVMSLFKFFPRA